MRGTRVAAAILLLPVLLSAPAALAHGGRYVGPVGERSPHGWPPNDWPPPDTGGSAPCPPVDGPQGPTPPEDSGAPAATCSRGPYPVYVPRDSWRFAWHLRENSVLDARFAHRTRTPAIRDPQAVGEALTARDVSERILPALRRAATDDRSWRGVASEAILGLARCEDAPSLALLRSSARNADVERRAGVVEESAVLALGILEGPPPGNAPILRAIVDDPEARFRSRAFATFALGLLERGRPSLDSFRILESRLFAEDAGWTGSAAVAAHGLARMDSPDAALILGRRLESLPPPARERKAPDREDREPALRCHVAWALGRSAGASRDPGIQEDALRSLEAVLRDGGDLPAQGAVLGLGFLGAGSGPKVALRCAHLLADHLQSDLSEPQSRRFAALALARVASRGHGAAGERALAALASAIEAASPTPSWSALAVGLAAQDLPPEERADLSRRVRKLWSSPSPEHARSVEDRGGCLVALGLLRDLPSRPLLERILRDAGEDRDLREYAASALGLLGDPAAIPTLRAVLAQKELRRMLRSVVVALGLLDDAESVPRIVEILRDPKSAESVLGGCTQALGMLRDARALGPLLESAADVDRLPDLTRARALAALARMAAGPRPDPFADFSEDVPYRACNDSLVELWSIL